MVGKPLYLRVALSDERRDSSASRPDLLYVRDDLLVESVACGNDEDGHFAVDEGDGAVLHLGSRIAFGVNVGDFLQFQCTFQGQGIVVAAPKVEAIPGIGEDGGKEGYLLIGLEGLLHLGRNQGELPDHLPIQLLGDGLPLRSQA